MEKNIKFKGVFCLLFEQKGKEEKTGNNKIRILFIILRYSFLNVFMCIFFSLHV